MISASRCILSSLAAEGAGCTVQSAVLKRALAAAIKSNLAPGGLLCLSGVRPHEIGSLKEAYGTWVEWEDWMYAEADPGVGGEAYWGTWARLVGRRVATPEQTAMLSEHAVS